MTKNAIITTNCPKEKLERERQQRIVEGEKDEVDGPECNQSRHVSSFDPSMRPYPLSIANIIS